MSNKSVIATIAAFVLLVCSGYLIHGVLLEHQYSHLPNLMRSGDDAVKHMPFIMIAQLLAAASLVWIYERGRSEAPWLGQGIRFGIAAAVFAPVVKFLTYYAVQQEPHDLAIHQMGAEGVAMVIICIVVSRIYK
jgi:hypothetical protein